MMSNPQCPPKCGKLLAQPGRGRQHRVTTISFTIPRRTSKPPSVAAFDPVLIQHGGPVRHNRYGG
jgi:hypothetical protein